MPLREIRGLAVSVFRNGRTKGIASCAVHRERRPQRQTKGVLAGIAEGDFAVDFPDVCEIEKGNQSKTEQP